MRLPLPLVRIQGMTMFATVPSSRFAPLPHSEVSELCSLSLGRGKSESIRAWLALLSLADIARRELEEGTSETTLDGVISRVVLRSLLGALHQRDISTVRHSRRVALLAVGLANHLGWEGRQSRVLEVAALLHDIGKIGVPDNVLHKPGKLNTDEVELMSLSFNVGIDILQACRVDAQVLEIISQSQATYAPNSDTQSVFVRDTHMGARILSVADAYESLVTEKAYRRARSHEEIMALLTENSGTQFDGNIVSSLARWVQRDGLPFAAQHADLSDVVRNPCDVDPAESHEAQTIYQVFNYLHTLEGLYDGFHLLDSECKFLIWSRGTETLLGRSANGVLGKTWDPSLLGYRDTNGNAVTRDTSLLRKVLVSGKPAIEQLESVCADGSIVQIELQSIPIFDERGEFQGAAELIRDLHRADGKRPHEFRELKLAATRDALTNVANRGELESQLQVLVKKFQESVCEPFSVIFADADHFKRINDAYGHGVGDKVLIDLANLWTRETYSGELIARYGGEEFVIVCPATDLEQAVRRAERLRTTLRESKIGGVDRLRVTASFGVAQIEPGDTGETLLRRADKALYSAKEGGRDRTCSLTNAELLNSAREKSFEETHEDPLTVKGSFVAVVASEMVVYKLGGFVSEYNVVLNEVTRERVVMRVGSSGLLSFLEWGAPPPVCIELSMSGLADSRSRGTSNRIQIGVSIRSMNNRIKPKAFQARASELMRELKSYFAAD